MRFFVYFCCVLGSVLSSFWHRKSTSKVLWDETVDIEKPLFSFSKTILLKLRRCLEATKIDTRTGFEVQCVFSIISVWKTCEKQLKFGSLK